MAVNQNDSSAANVSEVTLPDPGNDVTCNVYKPIKNNSLSFKLKLDVGQVSGQVTEPGNSIRIEGHVGTRTKTTDDRRGPFYFAVPVAYDSYLRASGSKPSEVEMKHDNDRPRMVVINGEDTQLSKPYLVAHKFDVTNDGPGSMPDNMLVIDVQLPVANVTSELLTIVGVEMYRRGPLETNKTTETKIVGSWIDEVVDPTNEHNDGNETTTTSRRRRREGSVDNEPVAAASVGDNDDEPSGFTKFINSILGRKDTENLVTLKFSCAEPSIIATCRTMRFRVDKLLARDKLEIQVNVSVRLDLWIPLKNVGKLLYSSNIMVSPGRVRGLSPANITNFDVQQSKITANTTTHMITKRPPAPMPVWVIPASIGIGIIIVILCMIVMKKCGFFRRRQHEKLQREKRESARLPLSDDDVIDDSLPIDARATNEGSCLDVSGKESGSRVPSEYDNDADTSLSVGGYNPENISKFGAREKY